MKRTERTEIRAAAFEELRGLSRAERQEFAAACRRLEASPEPDGGAKRALPAMPYKPGTCAYYYRSLVLIYAVEGQTLHIIRVRRARGNG